MRFLWLLAIATAAYGQSIEELVRRLGDEEWGVRREASRALLERADEAWTELGEAAGGVDPEVAWRAREILDRADRVADADLQAILWREFSAGLRTRLETDSTGRLVDLVDHSFRDPTLGVFAEWYARSFESTFRILPGVACRSSEVRMRWADTLRACMQSRLLEAGMVYVEEGEGGLAIMTIEEALAEERVVALLERAAGEGEYRRSARILMGRR